MVNGAGGSLGSRLSNCWTGTSKVGNDINNCVGGCESGRLRWYRGCTDCQMFAHQLTATSQIPFPHVGMDPELIRDCWEVHGALINVFWRHRITRGASRRRDESRGRRIAFSVDFSINPSFPRESCKSGAHTQDVYIQIDPVVLSSRNRDIELCKLVLTPPPECRPGRKISKSEKSKPYINYSCVCSTRSPCLRNGCQSGCSLCYLVFIQEIER
jgi:hypothetical protein